MSSVILPSSRIYQRAPQCIRRTRTIRILLCAWDQTVQLVCSIWRHPGLSCKTRACAPARPKFLLFTRDPATCSLARSLQLQPPLSTTTLNCTNNHHCTYSMADEVSIAKEEKRLASEVQDLHLKEEDRDADMDTLPAAELKSERSASHDRLAAQKTSHRHGFTECAYERWHQSLD